MDINNFRFTILVVFLIGIQEIRSTKEGQTTQQLDEKSNPLANVILNENEIGDVNGNGDHTKETSSRVKRQFYYDPYYPYYRRPVPVPVPILIGGGGLGFGRGFGGRGFGGRGFGGRGFGGRGFGGRGFGGRGFGGGRGGFGGGRGGRG
ncbi:hypothetical protein PYW08_016432 [Mythimna loreyi]|uniref:Uncharacterized protein n=1 Tax=Mythimna loreyi TaxID=667449 RepID=A0ACC2QY64_9NEOP|nr:hypothetical protein PYW08_016432 [Mythimna loreyi]